MAQQPFIAKHGLKVGDHDLVTLDSNGNLQIASGVRIEGVVDDISTVIANLDSDLSSVNTSIANLDSDLSNLDALPSQTGNSGNYLTTDGSNASWAALDTDANSTSKSLYEMANTISTNYTITAGNNAMSAGPITINSGVSVTIPSGSRWAIV